MDETSNVIPFPVRPQPAKPEYQPHPQDCSVYVRADSLALFVNGEERTKTSDFAFLHIDDSGAWKTFGPFETIEEATHAGRAYADAFEIVFQS